ncbi:hypothetical protein ACF3NA_10160 [Alkanindiges sp. WGS2144]|uniref:hypothetical protein n=1 Tax=Alkanindiges sp. WGS2144 TaxID=3366808 RepID=UPI0037528DA5
MTDLSPSQAPEPSLQQALLQSRAQQKRLNKITVITAVIMALLLSMITANQNLYSIVATFVVASGCFIAGSVYGRSLMLLIPLIMIYCVLDNYLSHDLIFHHKRFLLQFATLMIFTAIFHLSRPYLLNLLRSLLSK